MTVLCLFLLNEYSFSSIKMDYDWIRTNLPVNVEATALTIHYLCLFNEKS